MYKMMIAVAVIFAFVGLISPISHSAFARPHIVVDADTGTILSHREAQRRWAPASLTKLMTTYVTFHAIKSQWITMKSPVTMSAKASLQPPSKMGFPPGTVMTIDQAIKIIMVKSANDVALALGESVAGSEEAFVALMNSHARKLGMKDTQFRNPHGLPNKAQFTTAVDMAKLGISIQKEFPQYASYLKIPGLVHGKRRYRNYNRLLTRYRGTTGMKTGFVCASGYNLITSAERKTSYGEKRKLVSVVMGHSSGRRRNVTAARLLHHGFRKSKDYGTYTLYDLPPEENPIAKPADISDHICRKRRKARGKQTPVGQLEKIYLAKPFAIGRFQRIALGGATGPNPHASRFHKSQNNSGLIPLPVKRPDLVCPVITASLAPEMELPVVAAQPTAKPKKAKKRKGKKRRKSASTKPVFPLPNGCLPVPIAKAAVLVAGADLDAKSPDSAPSTSVTAFVQETPASQAADPFKIALGKVEQDRPVVSASAVKDQQGNRPVAKVPPKKPEAPTKIAGSPEKVKVAIGAPTKQASSQNENIVALATTVEVDRPVIASTLGAKKTENNAKDVARLTEEKPAARNVQEVVGKKEVGVAVPSTSDTIKPTSKILKEVVQTAKTAQPIVPAEKSEPDVKLEPVGNQLPVKTSTVDPAEIKLAEVTSDDREAELFPENSHDEDAVAAKTEPSKAASDREANEVDNQVILASLNVKELVVPTRRPQLAKPISPSAETVLAPTEGEPKQPEPVKSASVKPKLAKAEPETAKPEAADPVKTEPVSVAKVEPAIREVAPKAVVVKPEIKQVKEPEPVKKTAPLEKPKEVKAKQKSDPKKLKKTKAELKSAADKKRKKAKKKKAEKAKASKTASVDPISAERKNPSARKKKTPVQAGLCRMYRNSGCFSGVKKKGGQCPVLKNMYRQNRKTGLNCNFG